MSGYIGNIPVPQATQTRQSFTATASQTTFNTAGYSPGYIDVFLNGVKLAPADYTATNGSDVVLAVGAASGDILETVAYEIFQVLDQDFSGDFTVDGSTFVVDSTNDRVGVGTASPSTTLDLVGSWVSNTGQLSIDTPSGETYSGLAILNNGTPKGFLYHDNSAGALDLQTYTTDALRFKTNNAEAMRIDSSGNLLVGKTSSSATTQGIEARADGRLWVSTSSDDSIFNRAGTDGGILSLRKNGSEVGSIGVVSGNILIGSTTTGLNFADSIDAIIARRPSAPTTTLDGATSIGWSNQRFKDLYLSGGVYVGGTGSANKLDDVESGTWTATIGGTAGNPTSVNYLAQASLYTKVGDIVTVTGIIGFSTYTGGSGTLTIAGLPYAAASVAQNYACGACLLENVVLTSGYTYAVARTVLNQTYLEVIETGSNVGWRGIQMSQYPSNSSGKYVNFTVTYRAA